MAKKPRPVKIWNQMDEFGLINGLGHFSDNGKTLEYVRYPGETNKQLKARTQEAGKYRGNSTLQGMVNNISRDLGVSVSGRVTLPWYNTQTKTIFNLSEPPYPGPSGIKVYVSPSSSWSEDNLVLPQVRASGFADATSGWIVWNQPDIDPTSIPNGLPGSSGWHANNNLAGLYDEKIRFGDYTQILEFIGPSVPPNGHFVRVPCQKVNRQGYDSGCHSVTKSCLIQPRPPCGLLIRTGPYRSGANRGRIPGGVSG